MDTKLNAEGICNIVVQHACLKNTVRFIPSDMSRNLDAGIDTNAVQVAIR